MKHIAFLSFGKDSIAQLIKIKELGLPLDEVVYVDIRYTPETDAAAAHDDDADDVAPAIHYPTCRFCGKQTIPVAPYKTDADADEAATLKCDCFDARQYQSEVDRKKEREENIKKLRQRLCDFSAYTTARGMELAGDLYDFLLNVGTNVLDAKVAGATIKVGRFTVKFSVGSKSALSITFTYSDGAKLEV